MNNEKCSLGKKKIVKEQTQGAPYFMKKVIDVSKKV